MTNTSEHLTPPVEENRASHTRCKLTSALRLIGGKDVRIPDLAFPGSSPSRFARLLQLGNSSCTLLLSAGGQRTIVSGDRLAYLGGELEFFRDHIFQRSMSFLFQKQPFFVLSNPDPNKSFSAETGCDMQPTPRLCLSTHCVVVIMANWSGVPAVLYYGACDEAIAEVGRQVDALRIAASDPQIRQLVPRFVAQTTSPNGAVVSVQTRLPGRLSEFSWQRIDAATELWFSSNPTGKCGERSSVGQQVTELCESLPRFRDLIMPAKDALLEWYEKTRIPGDVTHGDFWLGNVLFTGDSVSGIIDWEWAQSDGLRMIDALHMLLMSYGVAHETGVTPYLRQLWADDIGDAALKDRIVKLCVQSGMDKDDLKFIALFLWFSYLRQNVVRGRMPSASWTEDMIPNTMPVIRKWLRQ